MISWRQVIALDARSLAVGRIGLGLLLILDLAFRSTDLVAHYTDEGVLPRSAIHYQAWDFGWSLHALSGSPGFEIVLFALAFLFAAALTLGFFTPWAAGASWILACSLHARNPLLRDGQDDLFRVLLFFAIFLPLGARFSLDARRRGRCLGANSVAGLAGAAFLAQLILIYWTSGITKLESPIWQGDGGVHYALSLSRYQTWLARALLPHHGLLRAAGMATEGAELFLPFLLLVPRWTWRFRLAAISVFTAMHLAFAACLHLGVFPFLSIVAWSMLLPSEVWDRSVRSEVAVSVERITARAVFAAIGAVVALFVNLVTVDPDFKLPRAIALVAVALGLQQYWAVFAPNPVSALAMNDGWFVAAGTLDDGRDVDAFLGSDRLTFDKPKSMADAQRNHRWRHYFANLRVIYPKDSETYDTIDRSRSALLEYLCRAWNERHETRLRSIKLVYMSQRLGEDMPVSPTSLKERTCAPEAVAAVGSP